MFSLRNKLNDISELQTEYDKNMTVIRKQQDYLTEMGSNVVNSINNYFQEVNCCLFVCTQDLHRMVNCCCVFHDYNTFNQS